MEKITKMGNERVFPLLVGMALPPMASMLVQSLYNIVDSMFIGISDSNVDCCLFGWNRSRC